MTALPRSPVTLADSGAIVRKNPNESPVNHRTFRGVSAARGRFAAGIPRRGSAPIGALLPRRISLSRYGRACPGHPIRTLRAFGDAPLDARTKSGHDEVRGESMPGAMLR